MYREKIMFNYNYETPEEYLNKSYEWRYNTPNICKIKDLTINHNDDGFYDLLWVKKDNPDIKTITHTILDPVEGYVPIGLRVIPKNFLGDNQPSRWMSLKYMYFKDNDETGDYEQNSINGSTTYKIMTWDEPIEYSPRTSKYTLDFLRSNNYKADKKNINYDYASFGYNIYMKKLFDDMNKHYIPSDNFNTMLITNDKEKNIKNYNYLDTVLDKKIIFDSNDVYGYNYIIIENTKGINNGYFLPPVISSNNKWFIENFNIKDDCALKDITGKSISNQIYTNIHNTPIGNEIIYKNKPIYKNRLEQLKPFYCCSCYKTLGTESGDWYLPALGELMFIMPALKYIDYIITTLNKKYPAHCFSDHLTNNGTILFSSSQYDHTQAWGIRIRDGYVSYKCYKSARLGVIAFLQYD